MGYDADENGDVPFIATQKKVEAFIKDIEANGLHE